MDIKSRIAFLMLIFEIQPSVLQDKEPSFQDTEKGVSNFCSQNAVKSTILSPFFNVLGECGILCFFPLTAVCYCLGCADMCTECLKGGARCLEYLAYHGKSKEGIQGHEDYQSDEIIRTKSE